MLLSFLQILLSLLSAASGAALAAFWQVSHHGLCDLISFAAGTLIATALLDIIPEALHVLPWPLVLTAVAAGYLAFSLMGKFLFHVCPACAASHFDEQSHKKFQTIAYLLAIALGIHCLMDGIALSLGEKLSFHSAWSIFWTVLSHKFPEGLALCSLFLGANYSRKHSLTLTLCLESLTLLGWVLGFFLLRNFAGENAMVVILLAIAGGFIYLGTHAIIGESRKHSPKHLLVYFGAGALFILLIQILAH